MGLINDSYRRSHNFVFKVLASDLDTVGHAEVSNTGALGAFTGATVAGIATQINWELDVTVDGGAVDKLVDINIDITDDWDAVAAAIQVSVRTATGSTETCVIVDGKIKIISATEGGSSAILIEAGSNGGGSGDLLAAITALGADYTATLDTPVDGTEGEVQITVDSSASVSNPTSEFAYQFSVVDSSNIQKAGLKSSYSKTTGKLTIEDNVAVTELATDDMVYIIGYFYTA